MQLVNKGHKAIQTDRGGNLWIPLLKLVVELDFTMAFFKQKSMVVAPPFWVRTDWRTDWLTVWLPVDMSAVVSNRNSRLYLNSTLWQHGAQVFNEIILNTHQLNWNWNCQPWWSGTLLWKEENYLKSFCYHIHYSECWD